MTDTGPFPHDREPGSPMLASTLLRENRALRRLLVRAVKACDPFCVIKNAHSHRADLREIIVAFNRLTAPERRKAKK